MGMNISELLSALDEAEHLLSGDSPDFYVAVGKLLAIAQSLDLTDESAWLKKELEGYTTKGGEEYLGDVLGVREGSPVPSIVAKYRLVTGTIFVGGVRSATQPMEYPLFFPDPVSQIERRANSPEVHTSQHLIITVPFANLPKKIQQITIKFGIMPQPFPLYFSPDVYNGILAGLKSELVIFMSRVRELVQRRGPHPGAVDLRALIITALSLEFRAVENFLNDIGEDCDAAGTIYAVGLSGGWRIWVAEVGPGNLSAATATERALQHVKPHAVLLVGVAGGIKDVKLGDVVAATKVYHYESGKELEAQFLPRPVAIECSYRMVQRARAEARSGAWVKQAPVVASSSALVAPIAAGERVIASEASAAYELIRRNYGDAVAVEMEGAGFVRALQEHPAIQFIVIRGISDLIDGKDAADASGAQKVAAQNAAVFALQLLRNLKI